MQNHKHSNPRTRLVAFLCTVLFSISVPMASLAASASASASMTATATATTTGTVKTSFATQATAVKNLPSSKYEISCTLDDAARTLSGTETINYTNHYEDALKELCLHLYPDSYNVNETKPSIGSNTDKELKPEEIGFIHITSVKIDGKDALFTDKDQLLRITLDKPLEKEAHTTITIDFSVKVPVGTDRLAWKSNVYSITNWYPIMSIYNDRTDQWDVNPFHPIGESNYSDASDYLVTLKTPRNMTIAPTGSITNTTYSEDTKTTTISSSQTRDFVFMMSSRYKTFESEWNGIKVYSYYIDDSENPYSSDLAKHLLNVVVDSLHFYSQQYGNYPYSELRIAETYLSGGAMEYPAVIQMGEYTGLDSDSMKQHSSWIEDAAAHETGHQWWYGVVGNNEFAEPLMDEGLNTFSTAYYFEKRYGKGNANSSTQKIRRKISAYTSKPVNSSVDTFANWNEYQQVIYGRGAEIFQDLMMRIGESKFLTVLQTYFNRYKFKNGSIDDFAAVLNEIGDKEISNYFLNAVNDASYFPEKIELTTQEVKQLKNLDDLTALELRESSLGINISSFLVHGLRGEQLILVLPTKGTPAYLKASTTYAAKLKGDLSKAYNIKLDIIKDSALTEVQKKANLILIGNNDTNTWMNQLKGSLPLKSNGTSVTIAGTHTPLKNMSAIYATKNPKNAKSVLLGIYWKDKLTRFDIVEDNYDKYIVECGDGVELRE